MICIEHHKHPQDMYKCWTMFTVNHAMICHIGASPPGKQRETWHKHISPHTTTMSLYVEINFTVGKCSLSARVFCNTWQDTFFNYGYIFHPAQQRLLSITTEHKNHREREHIQHLVLQSLFLSLQTIEKWSIYVLQVPDRDDGTTIDKCPRVFEQHRLYGPYKSNE